jgi:hypothetical protein
MPRRPATQNMLDGVMLISRPPLIVAFRMLAFRLADTRGFHSFGCPSPRASLPPVALSVSVWQWSTDNLFLRGERSLDRAMMPLRTVREAGTCSPPSGSTRLDAAQRKSLPGACRRASCPLMRQMQGFRGYYLLDAGPDVLINIIMFDSADEAFASNDTAANWVRNNVIEFAKGLSEVMIGNVLIAEVK